MVLEVVPSEKVVQKGARMVDGIERVGEIWPVLQRLELRL